LREANRYKQVHKNVLTKYYLCTKMIILFHFIHPKNEFHWIKIYLKAVINMLSKMITISLLIWKSSSCHSELYWYTFFSIACLYIYFVCHSIFKVVFHFFSSKLYSDMISGNCFKFHTRLKKALSNLRLQNFVNDSSIGLNYFIDTLMIWY